MPAAINSERANQLGKRAESYGPITNKSNNHLEAIGEWRESVITQ